MSGLLFDNDDIERELYLLGLSDGHHVGNIGMYPISPALSSIHPNIDIMPTAAPRSHSAPAPLYSIGGFHQGGMYSVYDPSAVHYPRHVDPHDFLTLPREPPSVSSSYYYAHDQMEEIPHYRPRNVSQFPYQPNYPRSHHQSSLDYPLAFPPSAPGKPPPLLQQQYVVSKIEAALRKLQQGLRDSYILSGSQISPPPPQPSSPHLRDPPPSPVPPYDHESPPGPSNRPTKGPGRPGGKNRQPYYFPDYPENTYSLPSSYKSNIKHHRNHPPLRKHKSHPEKFRPEHFHDFEESGRPFTSSSTHDLHSASSQHQLPTRIVGPQNASTLSRKIGFKPIQDPDLQLTDSSYKESETDDSYSERLKAPLPPISKSHSTQALLNVSSNEKQKSPQQGKSTLKTFQVEAEVLPIKPKRLASSASPRDPLAQKMQDLMSEDPEFIEEYHSYQRKRHHSFHHPHRHKHHRHHHRKQPGGSGDRGGGSFRRSRNAKKTEEDRDKVNYPDKFPGEGKGGTLISRISIVKDPNPAMGFGFSIKGGTDLGVGVFVSRVERDGAAWEAGLRPGDLLLGAGQAAFSALTHKQVIQILTQSKEVTLTVAKTSHLVTASNSYQYDASVTSSLLEQLHDNTQLSYADSSLPIPSFQISSVDDTLVTDLHTQSTHLDSNLLNGLASSLQQTGFVGQNATSSTNVDFTSSDNSGILGTNLHSTTEHLQSSVLYPSSILLPTTNLNGGAADYSLSSITSSFQSNLSLVTPTSSIITTTFSSTTSQQYPITVSTTVSSTTVGERSSNIAGNLLLQQQQHPQHQQQQQIQQHNYQQLNNLIPGVSELNLNSTKSEGLTNKTVFSSASSTGSIFSASETNQLTGTGVNLQSGTGLGLGFSSGSELGLTSVSGLTLNNEVGLNNSLGAGIGDHSGIGLPLSDAGVGLQSEAGLTLLSGTGSGVSAGLGLGIAGVSNLGLSTGTGVRTSSIVSSSSGHTHPTERSREAMHREDDGDLLHGSFGGGLSGMSSGVGSCGSSGDGRSGGADRSGVVVLAQKYTWVEPTGRATSPPPDYNIRLHGHQVVEVVCAVSPDESLGLMIRGGAEYGLGIYITGVDSGSAADRCGIKVGDQVLEVNGENFLSVTHDTAVTALKYSRRLRLKLRRLGKLPRSCTVFSRRNYHHKNMGAPVSAENMEATLAMIQEKSERVLPALPHRTLLRAVADYAGGRSPIDRLIDVAHQLLDTDQKRGLLTELREVVRTEDQSRFDSILFNQMGDPRQKPLIVGGMGHPEQLTHYQYDGFDLPNAPTGYRDARWALRSGGAAYNPYLSNSSYDEYDLRNRLRHGALNSGATPSRHLINDLLSEETLMRDITRGLREIAKTPSEDSGVELGSSYGLFGASRDYLRPQSIDRKRLRQRLLEDDPLLYMRQRSLDMPIGQHSGTSGEFGNSSAFDEYSRGDYLSARERMDIQRLWGSYEYGRNPLQRQERLPPSLGLDSRPSYSTQQRAHRLLPSIGGVVSQRSAAGGDLLGSHSQHIAEAGGSRLYDGGSTHLSKDKFETSQIGTTTKINARRRRRKRDQLHDEEIGEKILPDTNQVTAGGCGRTKGHKNTMDGQCADESPSVERMWDCRILDTMDHQQNYPMTSGLQCELKSSAHLKEEYNVNQEAFPTELTDQITSNQFMKTQGSTSIQNTRLDSPAIVRPGHKIKENRPIVETGHGMATSTIPMTAMSMERPLTSLCLENSEHRILTSSIHHTEFTSLIGPTATTFSQTKPKLSSIGHHHQQMNFSPTTQEQKLHLAQRGRSTVHTCDRDHNLDLEYRTDPCRLTRDLSLHSLDRYPTNSLSTTRSGNPATLTTSTKTLSSDLHLPHHLSLYPLHQPPGLQNLDTGNVPNLHQVSDNLKRSIPTPLLRRDMRSLSQTMNLNRSESNTSIANHTFDPSIIANILELRESTRGLIDPLPLNPKTEQYLDERSQHRSLQNLHQSLQDLRPGMRLARSQIGYKYPSSGYLSRSITKLFTGPTSGDYVSCDQMLSSLRRQSIEDEVMNLYQKRLINYDDIEKYGIEDLLERKCRLTEFEHYSSFDNLVFGRSRAKRIIRKLLKDRLRLRDINYLDNEDDFKIILDEYTRKYDEQYSHQVDYDRIVDEEIYRFDEDLRKADEIQRLKTASLSRELFVERCSGGRESGENVIVARDSRTEERGKVREKREASSVSPVRYTSAARERSATMCQSSVNLLQYHKDSSLNSRSAVSLKNLASSAGSVGRTAATSEASSRVPPTGVTSSIHTCRRTSVVLGDSKGRFRVVIAKSRPNLGIAIEGGADTKQSLPRVINIAANGAAFEAGGIRVGQLILAVDDQSLDGKSHEEAARLISSCWISRSRPEVEFLMMDKNPNPSDVRRSSIVGAGVS